MKFSINLWPSPTDWSWNPDVPDFSNLTSNMYLGALDPYLIEYIDSENSTLLLRSIENQQWTF